MNTKTSTGLPSEDVSDLMHPVTFRSHEVVTRLVVGVLITLLACSMLFPRSATDCVPATGDPVSVAGGSLHLQPVARGCGQVTDIQFVGERMVVLDKRGVAHWVEGSEFGVLFRLDVREVSEMGLLGIAFHPEDPGRAFVNYTPSGGKARTEIVEIRGAAPVRTLLSVEQPYSNHDAGQLLFGPDGKLYVGLGDGGAGGDPLDHGQNPSTLLGAILRLNVDGPLVPADNPFVGDDRVRDEIWAYGLRNPWRFSFTPDGRMITGDVGQNRFEEISIVGAGQNLGWRIREGAHCFNAASCETEGLVDPIWEYGHDLGVSVTGGYVSTSTEVAAIAGRYVFGDFTSGCIWSMAVPTTGRAQDVVLHGVFPLQISTFGRDPQGRVYVGDYRDGTIYQLIDG